MNKSYCIYSHTNKMNGKKYVGQTSKIPEKRWQNGAGYSTQSYFYKVIKKYGWDNFEHKILMKGLNKQEADLLEKHLIKKWDLMNRVSGYNLRAGGNDGILSEETRKKLSNSLKEKYANGYINPTKGRHLTEEQKTELRNKCSGWKHTPDAIEKIRQASLINSNKPEVKAKIIKALTGRPCKEETKIKISEAQKGRKQHPNTIKSHLKLVKCLNTGEIMFTYQFAEKYNLKTKNIRNGCNLGTSTQGYKFKYMEAM